MKGPSIRKRIEAAKPSRKPDQERSLVGVAQVIGVAAFILAAYWLFG